MSESGTKNIDFKCITINDDGRERQNGKTDESIFKKKDNLDGDGRTRGDIAIDSAKMDIIEERFNPLRFLAY